MIWTRPNPFRPSAPKALYDLLKDDKNPQLARRQNELMDKALRRMAIACSSSCPSAEYDQNKNRFPPLKTYDAKVLDGWDDPPQVVNARAMKADRIEPPQPPTGPAVAVADHRGDEGDPNDRAAAGDQAGSGNKTCRHGCDEACRGDDEANGGHDQARRDTSCNAIACRAAPQRPKLLVASSPLPSPRSSIAARRGFGGTSIWRLSDCVMGETLTQWREHAAIILHQDLFPTDGVLGIDHFVRRARRLVEEQLVRRVTSCVGQHAVSARLNASLAAAPSRCDNSIVLKTRRYSSPRHSVASRLSPDSAHSLKQDRIDHVVQLA